MRTAVQLYTLRTLLEKDTPGTLARLAATGLKNVELAGTYGIEPSAFRELLDKNGLRGFSAHLGWDDLTVRLEQTLAMTKAIGCEWLVLPWVPTERFDDPAKFAAELQAVALELKGHGIRFGYHNHSFEFRNDGKDYEAFWNAAGPDLEAELDLYWVHHAGQDPVGWLGRLKGQVRLSHFKDGHGDVFHPVGQGDLDWDKIIPAARHAGVQYAIIELDESPKDPLECVKESRDFLASMGVED